MSRQFLSLFYFFGGDGTDRAGLGGGCIPRRWRPQPQRTRADCDAQAAGQAVPEPGRERYQGRPRKARHTRPDAEHTAPFCTRYQTANAGQIVPAAGAGGRCNPSIMRIMIALSQAWYIDSNMNKYHKDILLFLVIVNYYLSIDIQPY